MGRKYGFSSPTSGDNALHQVSHADIAQFLRVRREMMGILGEGPVSLADETRDDGIAADLLERYGFVRLMELLSRFVRGPYDDDRVGHSLREFQAAIRGLLIQETKERVLSSRSTNRLPQTTPNSETRWALSH